MKGLRVTYFISKPAEYIHLLNSEVDPIHNDITVNGYGISLTEAKKIRDWFDKAIKEVNKKKHKKKVS